MFKSSSLSEYYSVISDTQGKKQGYLRVPNTKYDIPFTFICGAFPGKTLLITGGIHSCEYVGMEAAMRLTRRLDPAVTHGNVLILPIINTSGFRARQTTLVPEDMKNLNRVFPGNCHGTESEKIAAFLAEKLYPLADFYVDLHCGNQYEELVPHLYYSSLGAENLSIEAAKYINVPYMVRSNSEHGTCGSAARLGVPALLIERGGNGLWSEDEVSAVLSDLDNLMKYLHIIDGEAERFSPMPVEDCKYIDEFPSGLWYPAKKAGEHFLQGECLGVIRDMLYNATKAFTAPYDGVVLYQTSTLWADSFGDLIAYGKTN